MREIRQSGSEGGEPQPNAASLPDPRELATTETIHHLAMVATKKSLPPRPSTIWRWRLMRNVQAGADYPSPTVSIVTNGIFRVKMASPGKM
jgi:hypothetical protein